MSRQTALENLARIRHLRETRGTTLAELRDKQAGRVDGLQAALALAKDDLARAHRNVSQFSVEMERGEAEAVAELNETADPRIEHAIRKLRERHLSLNREFRFGEFPMTELDPASSRRGEYIGQSSAMFLNAPAVMARADEIANAIQQLEAMKLEDSGDVELEIASLTEHLLEPV